MAASRIIEELDAIAEDFIDAKKKQHDIWNEEEEAYYQLYLQEQDMEKCIYWVWYLIGNPHNLPKECVQQKMEFCFKLFPDKKEEKKWAVKYFNKI